MGSQRTSSAVAFRLAAGCLQGNRRNAFIALLAVGVLAFAAAHTWKQYGATHAHWETYTVAVRDIDVTPPPAWVHSDVKSDVVRLGSLERLSLLERDTTRHVAQAFALHPWVGRVHRVSKRYPAAMKVELSYRRPVAVVEVEHAGQPGLLPIDRDGILLPPEDFSVGQVKELPRISLGKTFPAGSVGTPWGEERVVAAALIAEAICDAWSRAPLFKIAALPALAGGSAEATSFEIVARDGRRFIWGRAPSREASGEKTPAEKRSRLLKQLAEPADGNVEQPFDLRT